MKPSKTTFFLLAIIAIFALSPLNTNAQGHWILGGNSLLPANDKVTNNNNFLGTNISVPLKIGANSNQHQLFIDNLSDFVGIGMDNLSNMHPQTNFHVNSLTYDPLYFTHSIATIRLTNLTSTNSGFNLRADNADAVFQNS